MTYLSNIMAENIIKTKKLCVYKNLKLEFFSGCDNGFYGFNCELECITCLNKSCDIFEGNCTYGCIDRYKGVKCKGMLN